jgi:hypothetical protein
MNKRLDPSLPPGMGRAQTSPNGRLIHPSILPYREGWVREGWVELGSSCRTRTRPRTLRFPVRVGSRACERGARPGSTSMELRRAASRPPRGRQRGAPPLPSGHFQAGAFKSGSMHVSVSKYSAASSASISASGSLPEGLPLRQAARGDSLPRFLPGSARIGHFLADNWRPREEFDELERVRSWTPPAHSSRRAETSHVISLNLHRREPDGSAAGNRRRGGLRSRAKKGTRQAA